MIKEIQLRVTINEEKQEGILLKKAARSLKLDTHSISGIKVLRKSIDARKNSIIFNYKLAIYIKEKIPEDPTYTFLYKDVSKKTILLYLKKSGYYWAVSIAGLIFLVSYGEIMGENFYRILYSFVVSVTIPHIFLINNILSESN